MRRKFGSVKLLRRFSRGRTRFASCLVIFVTGNSSTFNFNPVFRWLTRGLRGTRFSYTFYYPQPPPNATGAIRLSRGGPSPSASHPIHQSISVLDHEAIELLTLPPSKASRAHHDFAKYLTRTKNTICGRHPIGVLLGVLTELEKEEGRSVGIKWVRYEQSSKCLDIKDSSVSYASAYVKF